MQRQVIEQVLCRIQQACHQPRLKAGDNACANSGRHPPQRQVGMLGKRKQRTAAEQERTPDLRNNRGGNDLSSLLSLGYGQIFKTDT